MGGSLNRGRFVHLVGNVVQHSMWGVGAFEVMYVYHSIAMLPYYCSLK